MKMNSYEAPELEVVILDGNDIVTASPGDSPTVDMW